LSVPVNSGLEAAFLAGAIQLDWHEHVSGNMSLRNQVSERICFKDLTAASLAEKVPERIECGIDVIQRMIGHCDCFSASVGCHRPRSLSFTVRLGGRIL
jgi:hypothetical protein